MSVADEQHGKFVTFQSGNEFYGLRIEYVNEIIVFQEITEIPECPDYIKGLINLRGKIIPVVDVRLRFHQEPLEYNERTCIIVINADNNVVGLIVEKIAEVVEIPDDCILPSPSIGKNDSSKNKFVSGIGKVGDEVKLLLDPIKLLSDDEITMLDMIGTDVEILEGEE